MVRVDIWGGLGGSNFILGSREAAEGGVDGGGRVDDGRSEAGKDGCEVGVNRGSEIERDVNVGGGIKLFRCVGC